MSLVRGSHDRIVQAVVKLEGVIASPHRFGGTEFMLGRRELGHIHGESWADIAFPIEVRNRLVAEGRVEPHHVLPQSGWITFRFKRESDIQEAIDLFKMSYELAKKAQSLKAEIETRPQPTPIVSPIPGSSSTKLRFLGREN